MTIDSLRNEIDNIDSQLIDLLNLRYKTCIQIGELKKIHSAKVLNLDREQSIIERLKKMSNYTGMVETIWPVIMSFSKDLQNNMRD